jgi:hypothetical protein
VNPILLIVVQLSAILLTVVLPNALMLSLLILGFLFDYSEQQQLTG